MKQSVTSIHDLALMTATRLKVWTERLGVFMGSQIARRLVLGLFVIQAVVLVCVTGIGVPPDEQNHIQFIEYYAQHSLSPIITHQHPTYHLGDKTRELDYLYHYIMSLVYRVVPLATTGKYIAIRLFSVVFGLLSFLLLAKILKRIGVAAGVITSTFLILANLPMILMMSSAVNNDVLVWLGMLLGIFLLLRLWQEPTVLDFLWLIALSIVGGLVKRTLLPLGILFTFLAIIVLVQHFYAIMAQLKQFDWRICLAITIIILGSGLFVERVGGNIIHYHALTPSCEQVNDPDICSVFWPHIRAKTLAEQKPESITPLPFFAIEWFYNSIGNVADIQTQDWDHIVMPAWWETPLLVFFLVTGLAYGLYDDRMRLGDTKNDQTSRWRLYVLLIGLYFMAIHLVVNYQSYLDIKFFGIALNGRYIIPSLLPLAGLACFYWAKLLARHQRWLALITIVVILSTVFGAGLLTMLRNRELYRYESSLLSTLASVH
jgi:hypothetical protein